MPQLNSSAANLAVSSSDEVAHLPSRSRPMSMVSLTTPLSPTATRLSDNGPGLSVRNSLDLSLKKTSMELKNLRLEVGQDGAAKKFFGKMFKKRGPSENGANGSANGSEPRRSFSVSAKKTSPPPSISNAEGAPNVVVRPPPPLPGTLPSDFAQYAHGHSTFGTAPVVVYRRSSGSSTKSVDAPANGTAPAGPSTTGLGSSPPRLVTKEFGASLPLQPSNRPVGYTWSVKKWAKRNSEGWAAHLVAAAAAGLDMVNGGFSGEGDDEVIFEWVKLRSSSTSAGPNGSARTSVNGAFPGMLSKNGLVAVKSSSRTASVRGDVTPGNGEAEASKGDLPLQVIDAHLRALPPSPNPSLNIDPRPEPVRRVSASVSPSRRSRSSPPSVSDSDKEHDASSVHTHDMTAEEDSDPEDSETPWACTVWVKKTGQRQVLGTLTPAPHHPKVIASLKIPMSLDSVSLTDIKAPSGGMQAEVAKRVKEEVCLSEENLKDVVCVTAMWLVAREEFGGLGRRKRGSRH